MVSYYELALEYICVTNVCNFRLLLLTDLQCRIWVGPVLEEGCSKR